MAAFAALALLLGGAATTAARTGAEAVAVPAGTTASAQIDSIERGGERFGRAIRHHRLQELTSRRRELLSEAAGLGIAAGVPDERRGPAAGRRASLTELEQAVARLRQRVEGAREERGVAIAIEAAGISKATLDAIAACESGGDPGAVNAAGYYGKYQFDLATWRSVGGRGNPARAPEPEQDLRAAVLHQRTGGSAWPVCGS